MGEITVKSPGIAGEIKKGPSDLRMAEVRVAAPAGDQHFITSHSVRFKNTNHFNNLQEIQWSMYVYVY